MSERIPVVVAGVGHLGSIHARVLSELPEAELIGVLDADRARAEAQGEKLGVPAFTSVEDLPERLRAAIVATPTSSHRDVASRLLERGVDVLVEKPIAKTPAEGRELVELARRHERVLMVGHSERFNPVVLALEGQPLAPRFIESQRVSPFSFRSADVGVVLDMMIHDIDIILHLVRSPVSGVHAVGVPVIGRTTEDLANARIVFENGAVANVTASRVALKTERLMRIFSRDAYVSLDFHQKQGRIVRKGKALRDGDVDLAEAFASAPSPLHFMQQSLVEMTELSVPEIEPLKAEDRAFLDAVARRAEPPVTGEQGVEALEVAERIVASLRESLSRAGEDEALA
ncbi:MAG: Gfo/Idh/MocA family oxidoreductase [Planctomycetota bacterium]